MMTLSLEGALGDLQGGAQVVVGSLVLPVAQLAVCMGLAQLAARVLGVGGGGAVDRSPEEQRTVDVLEVVVLIAANEQRRGDGGGRLADGDGQVPG